MLLQKANHASSFYLQFSHNSKSEYYNNSGQNNGPYEIQLFIPNLHFITISYCEKKEHHILGLDELHKGYLLRIKHPALYIIRRKHRSLNSNSAHYLERPSIPSCHSYRVINDSTTSLGHINIMN